MGCKMGMTNTISVRIYSLPAHARVLPRHPLPHDQTHEDDRPSLPVARRLHHPLQRPLHGRAVRGVRANFIQQLGEHEFEPFSDHDLDGLSKLDINGREIKNLVKGALLLAREDDTKVTIGHLHRLAKMMLTAKQVLSE